jgi:hypothetical protein
LAPVLSLIVDRMCKLVNRPGQYPLAIICDEFSTIRATSIQTTIATGRSNDIVSVIAFQDLSQLKIRYSDAEAEALLNLPGSIMCGQVHGETARLVSQRFQPVMQTQISRSYNGRDTSINESEQPRTAILPATLSNLSSGEFVGIVADEPETPIEWKGFHAQIINNARALRREKEDWQPLPRINNLSEADIQANYLQIKRETVDLVKRNLRDISDDPESMNS